MAYEAELYSAVNTTLYRYFAIVGGFYTIASIIAAFVLAYLVRKHRPSFLWTLAGACCLLLAFVSWLVLVAPVNAEVAEAMTSAPDSVPAVWMRLRDRWEYGHATGFVITLAGLSLLLISILVDTPKSSR
ncbi:MAG: anthrone oxygenase family protein [Candidatus Binatia bacterium]